MKMENFGIFSKNKFALLQWKFEKYNFILVFFQNTLMDKLLAKISKRIHRNFELAKPKISLKLVDSFYVKSVKCFD